MAESSVYATEEFLAAAGRASGVRTSKAGEKYFVETLTGRHIDRRVGIPVTTVNDKGKARNKLVGTFRTLEGAYGFIVSNCPPAHVAPARTALCAYYGQPVGNLKLGPTAADLKENPNADDFLVVDGPIPGVLMAADHKPKKRKASGNKAAKGKVKKSAGKPKPKKIRFEPIKGVKGFAMIKPTAKPEVSKAFVPLMTGLDIVGARKKIANRGTAGLREWTDDKLGMTVIYTDSYPADKKTPRRNLWAPEGVEIHGDFLVRANKNYKLKWQEA